MKLNYSVGSTCRIHAFVFLAAIIGVSVLSSCSKDNDGLFTASTRPFHSVKDHVSGTSLYWDNSDRVRINNGSYSISIDAGDHNRATINATDVTSYGGNYYASYPAEISGIGVDGTVSFDLPRKEVYTTSGSNQVIHNVMAAKASDGHFDFENLCALLHFQLKASGEGVGAKLYAIEVSSDKPLCGNFNAAYSGGAWNVSVTSPSSDTLRTLHFSTPVELGTSSTDFYIVVPPVSGATRFRLRYVMEHSSSVLVFDKVKTDAISFSKNMIYHFVENTYNGTNMEFGASASVAPLAMDGTEANPILISSATTWDAASANLSNGSKHLALVNDIEVDATISTLAATLDGGGHTVTLTTQNTSLFTNINGGNVKDLRIEALQAVTNPVYSSPSSKYFGVLACQAYSGASIENCVSNVDISWTVGATAGFLGGLCGNADGCTFVNCRNEGNISSDAYHIGGIVGELRNSSTLSGCSNSGSITFATTTNYGSTVLCGGIAGETSGGSTLTGCINRGTITVSGSHTKTKTYVGGLFGQVKNNISNCMNYGNIVCNATDTYDKYIGGICGAHDQTTAATILNCSNEGNISMGDGVTKMYAGGIIGKDTYMHVKNCYAFCDIEGNTAAGVVAYGGTLFDATDIYNCYHYGSLVATSAYGIAGLSNGSYKLQLSYCYCNAGTICHSSCNLVTGNNALTDAFTVSGGGNLYEVLNTQWVSGWKGWRNGDTHVVFE